MPDRVIRDELLTSERYWRCSPEARCLYVSLLLSVDDAARFTGAAFALRTRCMAGTVSHERIEAILAELVDCDLVRRYISDHKPYLFVPRFRNRRRYIASSKYPDPPTEINDIEPKKADSSQPQVSPESDQSQTQDERGRRGVGVGVGVRTKPKPIVRFANAPDVPEGFRKFWTAYPATRRRVAKAKCLQVWLAKGVEPLADAVIAHLSAMKDTQQWHEGYEPAPLTYLNQRRWEDGLPTAAKATSPLL